MKKKFIALGVMTVLLIVAILAIFAVPMIMADAGVGDVSEKVAVVETADLAVMDSLVVLIADDMVPETISPTELTMWAALGVSLTITAVANRRRIDSLLKLVGRILGLSDIIADTGAGRGGGANKFIAPVAA